MTINVSLPTELEARVRQRVESGMYGSASEVIREALRLLDAYEQTREKQLEALRAEIAVGLEEISRGDIRTVGAADIKQKGREALESKRTTRR
ncbi:MAG: type II toxin-antitoxin system ParD family antitoxin [Burkholderiales bacterium]